MSVALAGTGRRPRIVTLPAAAQPYVVQIAQSGSDGDPAGAVRHVMPHHSVCL